MNEKKFNKAYGDIGEKIAQNYLKNNGYKLLICNFKNSLGEIDIIAKEKDIIVFVEVKYRKNNVFGLPREAVDFRKQQKIRMVATTYINKHNLQNQSCRFDVVEILGDQVSHIRNAF